MRTRLILYIVALFLIFSLPAESAGHIVTVHYPADLAVTEYNLLNISLSLPHGSADLIEAEVNSQMKASIVPRWKFACFSVPLELGINAINITAKKEGSIVDKVALAVFRRSDLASKYKEPPAGFTKDYFHSKDRSQCGGCHHVLEPGAADHKIINLESYAADPAQDQAVVPSESTCYSCHRGITSYSVAHGRLSRSYATRRMYLLVTCVVVQNDLL